MDTYGLLDQADEDAIHASRLLNIEEKLYRRIQKRLLAPDSCISSIPQAPPTPPPDASAADEAAAAKETEIRRRKKERHSWRSDALLDFAAFESNVTRVQFLLDSNERERARYAEEKERILETARAVRENNVLLHQQLQDAQDMLALRKTYDNLADQITRNPALKPRDEQQADIEKLHVEIVDLEHEGHEYKNTWAERREQFGKIVEEGTQMLRLIRDEKEEAERQEGMEGIEDGDSGTPKGTAPSRGATPKPDEGASTALVAQSRNQLLGAKEQTPLASSSNRSSRSGTPLQHSSAEKAASDDAGTSQKHIKRPRSASGSVAKQQREGDEAHSRDKEAQPAERMDTT